MLELHDGYGVRAADDDNEDLEGLRIIGNGLYDYSLDDLAKCTTRDDLAQKFYLRCGQRKGETSLLTKDGKIVGVTRITPDPGKARDEETDTVKQWSITAILPEHRGKGMSTPLREFALANTSAKNIYSRVDKDNHKSWSIAEKLGYGLHSDDGKERIYRLKSPAHRKTAAAAYVRGIQYPAVGYMQTHAQQESVAVWMKCAFDMSDSAATAIARSGPSHPTQKLMQQGAFSGKRVLHAGAGRETNPDRKIIDQASAEAVHYDPNHGPNDRTQLGRKDFDTVYSPYVLNVLPPDERKTAIRDIVTSMKSNGEAYIAVRSKQDVGDDKKNWKKYKDGYIVPGRKSFQRGFTSDELIGELSNSFGSVEPVQGGGHSTLVRVSNPLSSTKVAADLAHTSENTMIPSHFRAMRKAADFDNPRTMDIDTDSKRGGAGVIDRTEGKEKTAGQPGHSDRTPFVREVNQRNKNPHTFSTEHKPDKRDADGRANYVASTLKAKAKGGALGEEAQQEAQKKSAMTRGEIFAFYLKQGLERALLEKTASLSLADVVKFTRKNPELVFGTAGMVGSGVAHAGFKAFERKPKETRSEYWADIAQRAALGGVSGAIGGHLSRYKHLLPKTAEHFEDVVAGKPADVKGRDIKAPAPKGGEQGQVSSDGPNAYTQTLIEPGAAKEVMAADMGDATIAHCFSCAQLAHGRKVAARLLRSV